MDTKDLKISPGLRRIGNDLKYSIHPTHLSHLTKKNRHYTDSLIELLFKQLEFGDAAWKFNFLV